MTKQGVYELAEKHQVSISFEENRGYLSTIIVFGKRKNRKRFIESCEARRPIAFFITYIECRFWFMRKLSKCMLQLG